MTDRMTLGTETSPVKTVDAAAAVPQEKGAIGIALIVWLLGGGLGLAILVFLLLKIF